MSLLTWFTQKTADKPPLDAESSGLGHIDATVPFQPLDGSRLRMSPAANAVSRKTERLEQRELLYGVVRESMIRIGVLSSKYKFKVLSMDSRGNKYLIMMDLAKQHAVEVGRLSEIEGLIAKSAKARHNILVTAVYWRVSEQVSSDADESAASIATLASAKPVVAHLVERRKPRSESSLSDEVTAFKQALTSGSAPQKLSSPGEIVRTKWSRATPTPSFADTEFLDEAQMPLSGTQYGDLS